MDLIVLIVVLARSPYRHQASGIAAARPYCQRRIRKEIMRLESWCYSCSSVLCEDMGSFKRCPN